ncbi:MAG: ATP-grasp domain-containing protein [Lachnospiraceae bacterium]|nr:ATP-grasp domain-containing protein [Lachnospiraceae bacterium]
MMTKILIPNGSFHDIPIIKKAKDLGYYVITSGAAPDAIGHTYSDEYVYADFSDKYAILQVAKDKQIDKVCSNCNDFGYLSSCYIAEQLGLGGHESYTSARKLHKKDEFKILAEELKLSTPPAVGFTNMEDALLWVKSVEYPIMVKPTDLGAGQGITFAATEAEAEPAIKNAFEKSKAKRIVIEKYIKGTNHSFNAFVVDGKVRSYYSDNEYMGYSRYRVSTSAGPADGIEKAVEILISDTEKVTNKLGIKDGLMHSQYIMDAEGRPWIIEITRRMSGDWYPYPEMRATRTDWMEYIVKTQLGEDVSDFPKGLKQQGYTGRHCLNARKQGVIKNVRFKAELEKYIFDSVMWLDSGFRVNNLEKDYPGIIFFDFDDKEKMMHILENIDEYIEFEYV